MRTKTFSLVLSMLATVPAAAHPGDTVPDGQPATVTVTAKREPVVRKLDRTVHDVANLPRAANGSAQDVLQATPEVSVTADGRIAVRGNAQVTVLVDGKPAAMLSGADEERAVALQTMSGADIASIEVITNPSAAYQANGGAIVNLVLKRNRKPGAHAQLQGSAADHGLWNAGASGDLTRGTVSMHGSLALRHDGTRKIRRSAVDWDDVPGEARHTLQASEVFVRRTVQSAALGIDDALNDRDTLSLSLRHNARRSRPVFDVLNESRTGAAGGTVSETIYHRISEGPNEQSDHSASLAFSHRGDGTALKAMLQRSATTALVDKSYRDVFVLPAGATRTSHGASRQARRLDQATVDWTGAGQTHQWGMGLDLQDRRDSIDNTHSSIDLANGYAVRTTIAAAYLTDRITHGRWEALLGGRAERTALRVRPGAGTARARTVDPSLHLKYAIGDGGGLTLGYRRSLQLPDPRDLNPFTTYIDAQNLSRGNPDLRPQRMTSWEIGANGAGPRLQGSLGAFHRASRDTLLDVHHVLGDVLVTSKRNGGQARSAGLTGSVDWTPDPRLRLGMDASVYRVTIDMSGLAGQVNARAAWSAGPDDLSLDAHARSAGITPLGRDGATSSVNLGWKRRLSKTLSLTVTASDVFDGSRRTYAVHDGAFRQAGFDHFVARRLAVGFVQKIE